MIMFPQISLSVEVSPSDWHRTAPPGEPLLQAPLSQHPGLPGRHWRHHPLPHQQLHQAQVPGRGQVRRDGQRTETVGEDVAWAPQAVSARLSAGGRPRDTGSGQELSLHGPAQHDGLRGLLAGSQHRLQGTEELLHRVLLPSQWLTFSYGISQQWSLDMTIDKHLWPYLIRLWLNVEK